MFTLGYISVHPALPLVSWASLHRFSLPLLQASLDEPSHSVAIHHAQPTSLQSLTLLLSEKVQSTRM